MRAFSINILSLIVFALFTIAPWASHCFVTPTPTRHGVQQRRLKGSERMMTMESSTELAVFGGGCFWCIEACFRQLEGVKKVESGYAGGLQENPTYGSVCGGYSGGHAEVVGVEYDPTQVDFRELLEIHMAAHDPTQGNRQGLDVGSQYRSIVLYSTEQQRIATEEILEELETKYAGNPLNAVAKMSGLKKRIVTTEVSPLTKFYPAEKVHQDYYNKNKYIPYCVMNVVPKLVKVGPKDRCASFFGEV